MSMLRVSYAAAASAMIAAGFYLLRLPFFVTTTTRLFVSLLIYGPFLSFTLSGEYALPLRPTTEPFKLPIRKRDRARYASLYICYHCIFGQVEATLLSESSLRFPPACLRSAYARNLAAFGGNAWVRSPTDRRCRGDQEEDYVIWDDELHWHGGLGHRSAGISASFDVVTGIESLRASRGYSHN